MTRLRYFIFLSLICLPLATFANHFVAGKDYKLINRSSETKTSNPRVSVTEFFSYGCPWCYRIDPSINEWVKKQSTHIQFSRCPVVFHKDWVLYAKAYYAAHLLGQEATLNPLLFRTIQDKKRPLNTTQTMIDFFTAQGIDNMTAQSAFENSTTIDLQLKESSALMARYHVDVVPSFVVNHQYKTDLQMAKNTERLIKILDFLINKSI